MKEFVKEWIPYIVIIIVILLLRTYIITPVIVKGTSMEPNFIGKYYCFRLNLFLNSLYSHVSLKFLYLIYIYSIIWLFI